MKKILAGVTIFATLSSLLTSQTALAKEGFDIDLSKAPPAVFSAWESTFAVLWDSPTKYHVGAAFYVWEERTSISQQFYFLTANHTLNPDCESGKICPSTILVKNLRMKYLVDGRATLDFTSRAGFPKVEIVDRSVNPDLALLRVSISGDAIKAPIPLIPLTLPSNCDLKIGDPLYSIGFPATHDRTNATSLPIAESNIQMKRWSQGLFVGKFNERIGESIRLYLGVTTDALEGSSGGPIVNSVGEVVSVAVKGASLPSNQFQYLGNETKNQFDWHSLGTRCEVLQSLKSHFQNKNFRL